MADEEKKETAKKTAPKKAAAPRRTARFKSAACAVAAAIGTNTEIVPQEVPIAIDIIQEIRKKPIAS